MFQHVFKANPYHDHLGRFSRANEAKHTSHWAKFGSPKAKARALSGPAGAALMKKEFEELQSQGMKFNVPTNEQMFLEGMQKFLGPNVTLKEFVTAMAGEGSDPSEMTMNGLATGTRVEFSVGYGSRVHGARSEGFKRTFDLSTKDVHHDYWEINGEDRGGGAVKSFFREAIPLYKRLGMESVSVYANIDAGSYAWAKFGFKAATPSEASRVANKAVRKLDKVLDDNPNYKRVAVTPGTGNPQAKRELAMLRKVLSLPEDKLDLRILADLKTPVLDKLVAPSITVSNGRGAGKRQLRLPQFLMHNNGWDGFINLTDKQHLGRVQRYISPKKSKKS